MVHGRSNSAVWASRAAIAKGNAGDFRPGTQQRCCFSYRQRKNVYERNVQQLVANGRIKYWVERHETYALPTLLASVLFRLSLLNQSDPDCETTYPKIHN